MRTAICASHALIPPAAQAADCTTSAPEYIPVAHTLEASCSSGQTIVDLRRAKSPVVKLNFDTAQELTLSKISGAKSSGGRGNNAQFIWTSWNGVRPRGASPFSGDGFNDWDGSAGCGVRLPSGLRFVRALRSTKTPTSRTRASPSRAAEGALCPFAMQAQPRGGVPVQSRISQCSLPPTK